jgi:hypothetical protein
MNAAPQYSLRYSINLSSQTSWNWVFSPATSQRQTPKTKDAEFWWLGCLPSSLFVPAPTWIRPSILKRQVSWEYNINLFCIQNYHGESAGSVAKLWRKFKLRCLCNNRDLQAPFTLLSLAKLQTNWDSCLAPGAWRLIAPPFFWTMSIYVPVPVFSVSLGGPRESSLGGQLALRESRELLLERCSIVHVAETRMTLHRILTILKILKKTP